MKEIGIEWSGEIPNEWEFYRLKEVVSIQNGKEIEVELDEGIPVYGSGGIFKYTDSYIHDGKSVLLGRKGTIDNPQYVEGKFWTVDTSYYTIVNEEKLLIQLFYYMCQCFDYKYFQTGSTLPSMTQLDLGSIKLPIADSFEQKMIVDFLDNKIGKIDRAIKLFEQEIEKLDEYRKSLITQVVTKGLDSNVEKKDSGIEWIGDIPINWGIKPLKFLANKINSGKTPLGGAEIYLEEGIMLLRSQNIYAETLDLKDVVYIDELTDKQMNNSRVYQDDILLNITGGSIGRVGYYNLPYHANANQHVCIIRTKSEMLLPKYLYYFLNSNSGKEYVFFYQYGGNREALNFQQIGNFIIPLPSILEQKEIVSILDSKLKSIDKKGLRLTKQKHILQDMRKSLIFEYVTGKKRVF